MLEFGVALRMRLHWVRGCIWHFMESMKRTVCTIDMEFWNCCPTSRKSAFLHTSDLFYSFLELPLERNKIIASIRQLCTGF